MGFRSVAWRNVLRAAYPDRSVPLAGIAGAMEAVAGLRGATPVFTRNAIMFIDRRGTVSTRRIRDELGWEPRVDLDEGFRRTEKWLRAEGLL